MIEPGKDVLEDYLSALLSPDSGALDGRFSGGAIDPGQPPATCVPSEIHWDKRLPSPAGEEPKQWQEQKKPQQKPAQPELELESERKRQLQGLLSPRLTKTEVPYFPSDSDESGSSKSGEPKVQVEPEAQSAEFVVDAPLAKKDAIGRTEPKSDLIVGPSSEEVALKEPKPWCDNGRPEWAQAPFHALLFKVSGLSLAVPLVTLGQIHKLTDKLTPLFGQAEWFMGLQETPNGRVQAINTALYVMPERYDPSFLGSAKFVISINGLNWALAVDEVQQPQLLDPSDVTWRGERSKRPWLAGTVKSAMCALLDIPQMGYQLELQQKQSQKRFA